MEHGRPDADVDRNSVQRRQQRLHSIIFSVRFAGSFAGSSGKPERQRFGVGQRFSFGFFFAGNEDGNR
jgi:hypothetical protein